MVHIASPAAKYKYPECGSGHVDRVEYKECKHLICLDCGYDEGDKHK